MEVPFPFYTGRPQREPAANPAEFSSIASKPRIKRLYFADEGLVQAVNVSLILGRPLLLTGEPGTGKTQLAYSLAAHLGYEVLPFTTKSTSTRRELFYTYDTIAHFHASQFNEGDIQVRDYISFNALGKAIIRAHAFNEIENYLPRGYAPWGAPSKSIVLIDEIDKAPRDFPNDLLNEIEDMSFEIPELGRDSREIRAPESMKPVVVITSNSEKGLPDAFLRRCIYYDIPFPSDPDRLSEIVLAHIESYTAANTPWVSEAIDFFLTLRRIKPKLEKSPSTAELIDWLAHLGWNRVTTSLRQNPQLITEARGILFKTAADLARSKDITDAWLEAKGAAG
jgi:MoxR-like ATPase